MAESPPPMSLRNTWRGYRGLPGWLQLTFPIVAAIIVLGLASGGEGDTDTAGRDAAEFRERVREQLTPEMIVDIAGDGTRFCRLYGAGLAQGQSEDQLFGSFLTGYAGAKGGVPAREVFDEYVSRC